MAAILGRFAMAWDGFCFDGNLLRLDTSIDNAVRLAVSVQLVVSRTLQSPAVAHVCRRGGGRRLGHVGEATQSFGGRGV